MNAKQAKQISLVSILDQLKTKKHKETERDVWYYSPFRDEKTASFKVNKWKNVFYDFGEGKGGNVIDFVMLYFRCDFTEALHHIKDRYHSFSFDQHKDFKAKAGERKKDWTIRKIISVKHPALISYLKKRKVYEQRSSLKEIHYTVNNKFYFGIGFKNDSGGWEIRNRYAKNCLSKKDVTTIKNESRTLRIFEGFFDYLSFLQIRESLQFGDSDYLVLNSISLVDRVKNVLAEYDKIELYFDNDKGGNRATETLKTVRKNTEDNRLLYRSFKDLNEFITNKPMKTLY